MLLETLNLSIGNCSLLDKRLISDSIRVEFVTVASLGSSAGDAQKTLLSGDIFVITWAVGAKHYDPYALFLQKFFLLPLISVFIEWILSRVQRHAGLHQLHLQPATFILVRTVPFWFRHKADLLERGHPVILSGGKVTEHDPQDLLMAVWIPRVQGQGGYRDRDKDIGESLELCHLLVRQLVAEGGCSAGEIARCNLKRGAELAEALEATHRQHSGSKRHARPPDLDLEALEAALPLTPDGRDEPAGGPVLSGMHVCAVPVHKLPQVRCPAEKGGHGHVVEAGVDETRSLEGLLRRKPCVLIGGRDGGAVPGDAAAGVKRAQLGQGQERHGVGEIEPVVTSGRLVALVPERGEGGQVARARSAVVLELGDLSQAGAVLRQGAAGTRLADRPADGGEDELVDHLARPPERSPEVRKLQARDVGQERQQESSGGL